MPPNVASGWDKKIGRSLLTSWEKRFVSWIVPKIPTAITSEIMTCLTILWSAFILVFSFLAQWNMQWLWAVSLCIALQWFTDSLDGSLGRYRKQGLIRWGYYMDHFLDYIFLCCILIGYSFILPDQFKYLLFFLLAIFGGFMVHAFLRFAATNEFQIYYMGIGPTEIRIIFIVVNTLLIIFGKTYMAPALPFILLFSLAGLLYVVWETSALIWKKDKEYNQDAQ